MRNAWEFIVDVASVAAPILAAVVVVGAIAAFAILYLAAFFGVPYQVIAAIVFLAALVMTAAS